MSRLLCIVHLPPPNKRSGYDTKQSDGEVRVMLGVMAMKGCSTFPKAQHHCLESYTGHSLGEVLPLYKDAVSVFYRPNLNTTGQLVDGLQQKKENRFSLNGNGIMSSFLGRQFYRSTLYIYRYIYI